MEHLQHEDEQLEQLREWWNKYGKSIIAGVVMAIVVAVAVQSWRVNQRQHKEAASVEYSQMLALVEADPAQAMGIADRITADFSDTVYASLAAMLHARLASDKSDWPTAAKQLQWVVDHGDEEGLVHIARLRLARVLLQQGQAEQALALVKDIEAPAFGSEYAEVRGDIYLALGQKDEARAAYGKALAGASLERDTQLLQMKLDDLAVANGEAQK